jgi:uncharacterized membrane protein YgcG
MGEDFCAEDFTDSQAHTFWLVTLIASLLSLVGSSFMLLNYFLHNTGKNALLDLVAWLAFGDYLAAVNNIAKLAVLFYLPRLYTWPVCVLMRAFFQIAAGTTWCYTACIAFFLWRFLHTQSNEVSWLMWSIFHGISWGVPITGVIVMVSGNFVYKSETIQLCFPSQPWHIILWFIPIIISFAWMLICYFLIFYKLWSMRRGAKRVDEETNRKLRSVAIRFSFYIVAFFLCWVFDVITYFILQINPHCNVFTFVMLYTFFRNSQGMFDCLVYGFSNLKIRKRLTASKISFITCVWELALSPVLVLPAFISYIQVRLYAYLEQRKHEKEKRFALLFAPSIFRNNVTNDTSNIDYEIDGDNDDNINIKNNNNNNTTYNNNNNDNNNDKYDSSYSNSYKKMNKVPRHYWEHREEEKEEEEEGNLGLENEKKDKAGTHKKGVNSNGDDDEPGTEELGSSNELALQLQDISSSGSGSGSSSGSTSGSGSGSGSGGYEGGVGPSHRLVINADDEEEDPKEFHSLLNPNPGNNWRKD